MAIQNLGNLENLSFGINEVLFSYHLAPLNGNERVIVKGLLLVKSDRNDIFS